MSCHDRRRAKRSAIGFASLETGGLLLGYRASDREFVINSITLAGPDAERSRHHYVPDYDYDDKLLDDAFDKWGAKSIYLGDWHSHPGAIRGTLSKKDRRVLKTVAQSQDACTDTPLSLLLFGHSFNDCKIWAGEMARPIWGLSFLALVECEIDFF